MYVYMYICICITHIHIIYTNIHLPWLPYWCRKRRRWRPCQHARLSLCVFVCMCRLIDSYQILQKKERPQKGTWEWFLAYTKKGSWVILSIYCTLASKPCHSTPAIFFLGGVELFFNYSIVPYFLKAAGWLILHVGILIRLRLRIRIRLTFAWEHAYEHPDFA